MALRKGYSTVPGSARRVRTPSGEVISHRQYRNLVARDQGWRSLSELETDQGWAKFRFKIREHDAGRDTSYNSRLQADYVKVKRQRERRPPQRTARGWRKDPTLEPIGRDMKATPLGRLLIAMGAADDSETWGNY